LAIEPIGLNKIMTLIRFSTLAVCLAASAALHAQSKIYVRLTANDGSVVQGGTQAAGKPAGYFEVQNAALDVEQTLNIGSQSSGAGAGKITFNPFSFSMTPGSLDPKLFQMAASGTALKTVDVEMDQAQTAVVQFTLKLAAVKTISWSADPSTNQIRTQVTFEYGGLLVTAPAKSGATAVTQGWDRVKNIAITQ
jgi:type VI protein secretion system component Hcp